MDQCTNISGFAALPALERAAHESVPGAAPELLDDALVAAVRKGDEAAFELLFERHRRAVTRLAYRFFYRREQVEDIVQESFASAYFALGSYRGGQERSFIAWLTRITIRTCYNALRRARRTENSLSDLSEEETAMVSDRLRGAGRSNEIENAAVSRDLANKLLQRLDPEDRMVLTLLSVAELSVAETAEATGWSVSKVKMRAHRARRALQKVLHRFV
jgi:RNA polymerase sigma-70 factor (ECF subfamily)